MGGGLDPPKQLSRDGLVRVPVDRHPQRDDRVDVDAAVGLSIRQPLRECFAIAAAACCASSRGGRSVILRSMIAS